MYGEMRRVGQRRKCTLFNFYFLFWNSAGRAEVNLKQITWKLKYKIAIQNFGEFVSVQETILSYNIRLRDLRSSGMLCSVDWWLVTSVSEISVTNYRCMLCNIPEELRSHLHCSRSLKSSCNWTLIYVLPVLNIYLINMLQHNHLLNTNYKFDLYLQME